MRNNFYPSYRKKTVRISFLIFLSCIVQDKIKKLKKKTKIKISTEFII